MGEAPLKRVSFFGRIQAQEAVQPFLNGVVDTIPDRLFQLYIHESTAGQSTRLVLLLVSIPQHRLFSQTAEKLEGKTATSAFVTMYGGRENDHVRSQELLDERDWDSSSLIHNEEFSLAEGGTILRSDVLNSLSVVAVDVNSNNGVVELRVSALEDFIVGVLLVVESI